MRQLQAGAAALLAALSLTLLAAPARADARAEIKAIEDRFVAAFKAKNVDAIMKVYVPDQSLIVFDVVPLGSMSVPPPIARTGRPSSTC